MTSSIVQTSSVGTASGYVGTASAVFSTSPTVGNLIVLSGIADFVPTISGFTVISSTATVSYPHGQGFVAYGYAAGGPLTVSIPNASQFVSFVGQEIVGIVASGPLGQQAQTAAISTAPTATTAGSVNAGDFVVSVYAIGGNPGTTTATPATGFTYTTNVNVPGAGGFVSAYEIPGSAGAVSAAWPYMGTVDTNLAMVVSFLAASVTASDPSASSKRFNSQRHSFGLSR